MNGYEGWVRISDASNPEEHLLWVSKFEEKHDSHIRLCKLGMSLRTHPRNVSMLVRAMFPITNILIETSDGVCQTISDAMNLPLYVGLNCYDTGHPLRVA